MLRFLLFLIFLPAFCSSADCNSHYIFSFPKSGGEISSDGIILLDFYAGSERVADSIAKGAPTYLVSGDQRIQLILEEQLKGEYNITQVVLRPETSLTVGNTYTLHIDGLDSYNHDIIYGIEGNRAYRKSKFYWTAKASSNVETPEWAQLPAASGTSSMLYGCGPKLQSNFTFISQDSTATFIRVELFHEDGKSTTYIVLTENNKFSLGRGMCRGPFNFKEGESYEARFKLMNSNGNTSTEWTERIEVPNPW